MVTYEALASGLPVVATPNAGSWVRDGVDGLIVPAGNPEALAAAIERLAGDRSLLADLSHNALQRRKELGLDALQQRLVRVIGEAVAQPSGSRETARKVFHWTPRYLLDRGRLMLYERTHPNSPWLTPTAVKILDQRLKPQHRGLEWGSGRSTLWFAQRVSALVSVEHNPYWHQWVASLLTKRTLSNVDLRMYPEEPAYLAAAEALPPESMDFCLVDGFARDRCALNAVRVLKPGGLLILDNSNWYLPSRSRSPNSRTDEQGPSSEIWRQFLERVRGWPCTWTSNGVTDTTLWTKPSCP